MERNEKEKTSLAERAETAIVEKEKKETGIVEKKKGETAVMKKEKAETAVVKKEKAETAVIMKEKTETAVMAVESADKQAGKAKKPAAAKKTGTAEKKAAGTKKTTAAKKTGTKAETAKKKTGAKAGAAKKSGAAAGAEKKAGSKESNQAGIGRDGIEYIDIVNYVREKLKTADAEVIDGKAAYQVDITGQGSGIFYIEIVDGFLAVEPYDYRDRDARLVISSDDLLDLLEEKLNFDKALTEGRLYVDGDWDRVMELKKLFIQL